MSLVVVTGGARSGKSAAAESLALRRGGDVTVVCFGDAKGDAEMGERIAAHRERRPEGWRTLEPESSTGWIGQVAPDALLLLDCLGTLLGRVMLEVSAEHSEDASGDEVPVAYSRAVEERFDALVAGLAGRVGDTLVVTNEVGDGIVPAYPLGRLFRDVLGRANRRLVSAADAAWLVVAGRVLELTALPRELGCPED